MMPARECVVDVRSVAMFCKACGAKAIFSRTEMRQAGIWTSNHYLPTAVSFLMSINGKPAAWSLLGRRE